MTDLNTLFAAPQADALSILLGHDIEEAASWWFGGDYAGLNPATVQDLLVARRVVRGQASARDAVEVGIAAVTSFLVPIASTLAEIDAIHDDLSLWLAPMLDETNRMRVLGRAAAALDVLDEPTIDRDERIACVEAVQATAFEMAFERATCSVNVVSLPTGEHRVMIVASPLGSDDLIEIGNMPFGSDDGHGPGDRTRTPVAPVPLNA